MPPMYSCVREQRDYPVQAASTYIDIFKARTAAVALDPENDAAQENADTSCNSEVLPKEFLRVLQAVKSKARKIDVGNDAGEEEIAKNPFRLLALPTELRQIVLNHVFGPDATNPVLIHWPALLPPGKLKHSSLFTNALLRKEAFDVLCMHRTFAITSDIGIPLTGAGKWELAQWIRTLRQTIHVKVKTLDSEGGERRIFVTVTVPEGGGLVGTARQPGPLALWNTRDFPMLRTLTLELVVMEEVFVVGYDEEEQDEVYHDYEEQDEEYHDYEQQDDQARDEEHKRMMSEMARQLRSCILLAKMGVPEPKVVGNLYKSLIAPLENAMKYTGEGTVKPEERK